MSKRVNRYKRMERYMTFTLLADAFLFVLFLIGAANGILWLKILTAIFTILISGLCLGFLYLSKELLKQRSLWMSAAAAAILICTLFSLILNFPSPSPYSQTDVDAITAISRIFL